MSMKHIIELQDLLDDPAVNGQTVADYLRSYGAENIQVKTLTGEKGSTDFVKVLIPGSRGKSSGGDFPTLGIVGLLGGLGARPERIGYISEGAESFGDMSATARLADMHSRID